MPRVGPWLMVVWHSWLKDFRQIDTPSNLPNLLGSFNETFSPRCVRGSFCRSSAAPKKKSFDRGGPVWPSRSNVTNDRLRGAGALPPQPKTGGSGRQYPPAKTEKF